MSKDSSDKHYEKTKKGFKKMGSVRYQDLAEKEKDKK